jgi:hypothetical protein
MMDQALDPLSTRPARDCNKDELSPPAPELLIAPVENEIFCECKLNLKEKEKKYLNGVLGEYESSELTVGTGNDNFLHGALQDSVLKKYDGDDKGRTFSGNIDYTLTGTEGEFKLSLDTTGFSRLETVNGTKYNSDGKRYLNFLERDTLDLRLDKNISKGDGSKFYLISEVKFTNETDFGSLSRSAQEMWHRKLRDSGVFNAIQYDYIKKESDKKNISTLLGLGKKWVSDVGNWKCQSALEAAGGMSINLKGNMSPEFSASASTKASYSSLPWLALSSWINASSGFQGKALEMGLKLSVEKKIKNVRVIPFIGIEYHKTETDKKYGSVNGKPYEAYHVLGVSIKY